MIRRITLENYMSHSHTVIEPAAGLTVLVGPNNCGKSAVLSAIQAVCGETSSDYMVRHGEKTCRVTIETDDDHTITWQRKGGATSYTIDGTDVHRVGRGRGGLPDDLHTFLRMPIIEAQGNRTFQVHFGSQKDPIFLLGSDSDLAAFFSSSDESERLMEMQKRHKAKVASRRAEQRAIEADLTQLDGKLSTLEPLEALAPRLEQVEAEHRSLVEADRAVVQLAERIDRLHRLSGQVDRLNAELTAGDALQPPPTLVDTRPLESQIADLSRWRHEADRQEKLHQALSALTDPPTVSDVGQLATLGKALRTAREASDRARAVADVLEGLGDVPKQEDLTPLEQTLLHLQRANAATGAATANLASAEQAVAKVEAEIVRYVTQHPLCPTCGGPLTAAHVMHGGSDHGVQT